MFTGCTIASGTSFITVFDARGQPRRLFKTPGGQATFEHEGANFWDMYHVDPSTSDSNGNSIHVHIDFFLFSSPSSAECNRGRFVVKVAVSDSSLFSRSLLLKLLTASLSLFFTTFSTGVLFPGAVLPRRMDAAGPHGLAMRLERQYNANRGSFPCEDCGKVFTWKQSRALHRRLECGKEPQFHCPHCDYKGSQKAHLKSHMERRHGKHLSRPQEELRQTS